jgi:predicted DNA-binding transcriptional regulator YafY
MGHPPARCRADPGCLECARQDCRRLAQGFARRDGQHGLWAATVEGAGTVVDAKLVREAIRREQKLQIAYVAETGAPTKRAIWPIAMAFYERRQTVAAWCELRGAFRHFRTDRTGEAAIAARSATRPISI